MAEKICSSGHVYNEKVCDRCGGVDPRLAQAEESNEVATAEAPVESKSVARRKAASKPAPKKVAKAKAKKGKK